MSTSGKSREYILHPSIIGEDDGDSIIVNDDYDGIIPFRKITSDDNLRFFDTFRRPYLGFNKPLSGSWFISATGVDYCLMYFWIAKDLSWMQSWLDDSICCGLLALSWSLLVLYHAIRTLNWHELWNFIALFLWLFANYW